MRVLFFLALFVASVSGAIENAKNPAPGGEEAYCLLRSVGFTNGITMNSEFDPKTFSYAINCPSLPLSSVITPELEDPGSTAEIYFNKQAINTKDGNNAISNNGNVALSPNKQSDSLTFVEGLNAIEIGVSCNGLGMPTPCYYKYTFTCSCAPADPDGSVIGDPQFTGLRGQNYQVHGVSGEIYNIVSDPAFQLNARFVFLDAGKCPVVEGKKLKGCWSHPGSYLGEIGLKTRAGDRIALISGEAENGFQSVTVNGKSMAVGDVVFLKGDVGTISLNSTHAAEINIGHWQFSYENSDMYVNQRVRVTDAQKLKSHGLLGQTWKDTTYSNTIKYVQGQVDDYVIRDADLFGDNFVFNMFN